MIRILRLFFVVALVSGCVGAAFAQVGSAPAPTADAAVTMETEQQLSAHVDTLNGKLAALEKDLTTGEQTAATLAKLAVDVAPLGQDAQALIDRLTPRVAAFKARLDQLGPKPEAKPDKSPGEAPDVAKERDTLQKSYDDADGLLRRTRVLALKADQDSAFIARRQRALFTVSLLERSSSLISPQLWRRVAAETPANVADTSRVFNDWLAGFNAGLSGGKLVTFWVLVLGIIVLYWPLTRFLKRIVRRVFKADDKPSTKPDAKPDTWHKIIVACWTSVSVSGAMIAIMYGVVYVFTFFAVPDPRVAPLFDAMQAGIIRIALAAGFARGILAPRKPRLRLVAVDDGTADKLIRIVVGVAIIVSGTKVIEALNTIIYASRDFSVAARGVGAVLVALALALAMIDLGRDSEADNSESGGAQRRDWQGLVRGATWGLVVVIIGAALAGYGPFASFLVDQVVLVAATLAVLFLAVRLIDKACEKGFRPGSPVGRNLIYTVGLRRETLGQMSVLIAGFSRVALIGLALLVVAAPWGMQSTDIAGNLQAIFFGFKIGDVTISIEGIVVAIVSFVVVLAATRAVQGWLEDRYLPQTRLDSGLRNSIKTSLGYVGVVIALSLAAGSLGLDFQKLAIVAGALSIGVGFGLQSIVNNFVSGLILLWERAVRVGDWVIVGSDQGYVRKINVRSTEIETFDRASVIVPNSNLVSGVVKNLMRADKMGRLSIEVTVHSAADPETVRETLIDIARDNDAVTAFPAPQVRFTDLKAAAMTFELFCFVSDVESMARTKSDLYFEVYKRFKAAKFFDGPAPPPTGIDIVGLDRLEAVLRESRAQAEVAERPARAARKAS